MRKNYVFTFLLGMFCCYFSIAQLNYTMVPSASVYTSLSGGTSIPDLSAGSDMTITAALPIGFDFEFDDTTYTEFQMCDNGYIHLGNELFPTGYGNAGGDVVIPNDFKDSSAMNPGDNTTRPFIAPLWEELAIANIGGNCSYLTSGIAPNRILTIEWDKVSWRASTGTDQISFQIILHETTNVIDFIYKEGPVALGSLPTASIGLAGRMDGDFYSLSDSGPNPVASKTINTVDIGTKPADGQMYTWIPASPSGLSSANNYNLNIYYEHAKNCLHTQGDLGSGTKLSVVVCDMLGKEIYTGSPDAKGREDLRILLPELLSGVYIVRISGGPVEWRSKFIKD